MRPNPVSSDVDAQLAAVGHAERRLVLYALRDAGEEGGSGVRIAGVCDGADDASEISLRHSHLPKLEELGLVTADAGHVERGPKFEALVPLLDYLEATYPGVDQPDAVCRRDQ